MNETGNKAGKITEGLPVQVLMRLAADRGHRTPAGHHCHTISALLQVEPEHDNQARRRLAILAVETAGLAKALSDLSSHDRGGPDA